MSSENNLADDIMKATLISLTVAKNPADVMTLSNRTAYRWLTRPIEGKPIQFFPAVIGIFNYAEPYVYRFSEKNNTARHDWWLPMENVWPSEIKNLEFVLVASNHSFSRHKPMSAVSLDIPLKKEQGNLLSGPGKKDVGK